MPLASPIQRNNSLSFGVEAFAFRAEPINKHEVVRHPVSFVCVIIFCHTARLCRFFIHANNRTKGLIGASKMSSSAATNFRRDDPAFAQVRLKFVFVIARRAVSLETLGTISISTNLRG